MKNGLKLALLLLLALPAAAQFGAIWQGPPPTLNCSGPGLGLDKLTPQLYLCALNAQGIYIWQAVAGGGGAGNVNGPGSSTAPHVAVFANGTGKLLADGGGPLAATIAAVTHQFLTGYTLSTGIFTQAQPTLADLANGTSTANFVQGNAGSYSPIGFGQIVASQTWASAGMLGPAINYTTSGGSFQAGHAISVRYVLVTAAGLTLPSVATNGGNTLFGCSSGVSCQLTITAPPLPAGYTWNAYAQDCGSTPCGGSEQLQASCTQISGNCVLNSVAAGAAPPTVSTAYLQPSGVQATECPQGVIPWLFTPDQAGNFHTSAGVDFSSGNGRTTGTLEFCRSTWFTDQQNEPLFGNNAFVAIDHGTGINTSLANQDRTLWVGHQMPAGFSGSVYGIEGIQAETDLNCNGCSITGSPDGDIETASFQLSDNMQTNPNPAAGIQVIRANYDRKATAAAYNTGTRTIFATWNSGSNSGFSPGAQGLVVDARCQNNAGALTNISCDGYQFISPPNANKFSSVGAFVWNLNGAGFTPGANDFFLRNDAIGANVWLNGPTTLASIINNLSTPTLPVSGSTVVTPSLSVAQATISAPSSVNCSGGTNAFSYAYVGVDGNGGQVASANANSGNLCVNPLTGGNPATIAVGFSGAAVAQFARIDVYRTAGPMGLGKIGSLSCAATAPGPATCANFSDTGLTASGTLPVTNTTGSIAAPSATLQALTLPNPLTPANGGTGQTATVWADPRNSGPLGVVPAAGGDWCAGVNAMWSVSNAVDATNVGIWPSAGILYCNSNPFAGAPTGFRIKLPCNQGISSKTWATGTGAMEVDPCPASSQHSVGQNGSLWEMCSDSTGVTGCGPNGFPSFELTPMNFYPVGAPHAPDLKAYSSGATWGTHLSNGSSVLSSGTATFTHLSATVTGSGTAWTADLVGGFLVDCDIATRPGACTSMGRITAVGSTTSITLTAGWRGSSGAAHSYTGWVSNIPVFFADGLGGALDLTIFGHRLGPMNFDLAGIANATAYLNAGGVQEHSVVEGIMVAHNHSTQPNVESNQAYACAVWDATFRPAATGQAHWSVTEPPECSTFNGGGATSYGWIVEMRSATANPTIPGSGPSIFHGGSVVGSSGHAFQAGLVLDGLLGVADIDCGHFEWMGGDAVEIGGINAVTGVKLTGCNVGNSMVGDVVHVLTAATGTNSNNIVENVSSRIGNTRLVVDDNNTATNVTGKTYLDRWAESGGSFAYTDSLTAFTGVTAPGFISGGTLFTSNGGCTESALAGGATAGKFFVGQNTACTIVITMGAGTTTPAHGWFCTAYDQTGVPAVAIRQTANTTSSCSLLMTVATNDLIVFSATGF